MKFLIFVLSIVCVFLVAVAEDKKPVIKEEPGKKRYIPPTPDMKTPFNPEMYQYAVAQTKKAVMEKLKETLMPDQLKDPTLSAKLSPEEKKKLMKRYENSYQYEKENMSKELEKSMEKTKEMMGRLTKEQIDLSIQSLVEELEAVDNKPIGKTEL